MARTKRETPRAAAAYQVYAAMGMGRSIAKLRKELLGNSDWQGAVPSQRRLEEWSSAHHWQDRVKTYDADRIEEQRQAKEALKEQTNADHFNIGMTAAQVAVDQINRLIQNEKFGSQAAVQLLKLATDLQRLSLGLDKPDFSQGPQVAGIQIVIETDNTPVNIPELPKEDTPKALGPAIVEGKVTEVVETFTTEDDGK